MSYVFPEGVYTDVRIEHIFSTKLLYKFRELEECKEKSYSAAFIRVYDGSRWYYGSTSDISSIQNQIDSLSALADKNGDVLNTEVYSRLSQNKDEVMAYKGQEVSKISLDEKMDLLKSAMGVLEGGDHIKLWDAVYVDEYKVKEFYNSKGANLKFDYQRCAIKYGFQMASGERHLREAYQLCKYKFSELKDFEEGLKGFIKECREYLLNSEAVEPGIYTVILSPIVTGVFAHECFGHKSEADFMLGDEQMKKDWAIGKKVGNEYLTIVDTGTTLGQGYIPYDDEGNKASVTYLVKKGILSGRLHNAASAADLGEGVTGNARAISYEFEPIVRMTTTYIEKGNKPLEELIGEVKNGIFVKDIFHGSGMSTFTLAPSLAYYIKDGKIDKPVRIAVVTGNVFEALSNIDGLSDEAQYSTAGGTGGCGKMEQYPLPVDFGGPYIRVNNMTVQ